MSAPKKSLPYTLADLIEFHPNPRSGSVAWVAHKLKAIGFTLDYQMSFNVVTNGAFVFKSIPDISNHDDFLWLCNQIANTYKQPEYSACRDNDRLCRATFSGKPTGEYTQAKDAGCCGFYDVQLINPKTKSAFWLGFNYGH